MSRTAPSAASALKRLIGLGRVSCNICGGTGFEPLKGRGDLRCTTCRSSERTRMVKLYLDRFARLRPGLRVLHLAPEKQLFPLIAEAVGEGYDPRDLAPERYSRLSHGAVSVRAFDLCTGVESLPDDTYDLVLHNHVMEHLPCNVTAVLWHLHRALAPGGLHLFSVPIIGRSYEEDLSDLGPDERLRRFHQADHIRNFGADDLSRTIGMVFDIEEILATPPARIFGEDTLRRHNIPETRWHRFTGAACFTLRKDDLKLRPGRT